MGSKNVHKYTLPQGSVLAALFFNLCVCDITGALSGCQQCHFYQGTKAFFRLGELNTNKTETTSLHLFQQSSSKSYWALHFTTTVARTCKYLLVTVAGTLDYKRHLKNMTAKLQLGKTSSTFKLRGTTWGSIPLKYYEPHHLG